MAQVNQVYIAVIGVGNVGTHFLSQLATLLPAHPNTTLLLISRTTTSILGTPTTPLSLSLPPKTSIQDLLSTSPHPAPSIPSLLAHLTALPPSSRAILVDNTSSQSLADAYPLFLTNGISIVTPNKLAFSGSLELWNEIHQPRSNTPSSSRGYIYHEATVGAALPVLSTLHTLLDTNDRVRKITGVFSGTLSYLFNTFSPLPQSQSPQTSAQSPPAWSALIATALAAGYTEPDPRSDLSGADVARKLLILARILNLPPASTSSLSSISTQSLIPPPLANIPSTDDFLARLGDYDADMARVREEAGKEGKVLRYVGSIDVERGEVKVGMEWVGAGTAMAGLRGSDNLVEFWTERYGDNPLVVQGAGAGGAVTAMGVMGDLLKVIERIS